jgi:hypothetical protein
MLRFISVRFPLLTVICVVVSVIVNIPATASAQYFGVADWCSPLVWTPGVEGDVKARLVWVNIGSGSVSGLEGGSLIGTFHMTKAPVFIDSVARFQVSRVSVRTIYEPRDFSGFRLGFDTEARLSYSGFRLGGDFDIIQWNKTRMGVNMDYDFYAIKFTYPSNISPFPRAITGTNALTAGIHAIYNPLKTVFGISGLFEARVRWPVTGTDVTDWELGVGIASPATLMGSCSLTAGYRNTRVSFNKGDVRQIDFDVVFNGWFTELAFYY